MTTATKAPLKQCVVLVEDEPLTRGVAAELLTEAGLIVLEAGHADDALRILESQASDVHILFTDIHMPGSLDGLELAHHTRRVWPWIALLIASGKARPAFIDMPAGSRFLPKPYDFDHMLSHVRELIAGGRAIV